MNKKSLLSILTAVVLLATMTITAFAVEPTMPDHNGNVSIGKEEIIIGIEGRVEPITLAAPATSAPIFPLIPINRRDSSWFPRSSP